MTQNTEHYIFLADGTLQNIPSSTSLQHDFDFYVGKWKIRNRKLKTRLNNCTEWEEFDAKQEMRIILNGLGNIDDFHATFDGEPFVGMSLRLFDPKTRLWSIYWADVNKTGLLEAPVQGSFHGSVGVFCTKDTFHGKDILVKFEWDKTDPENSVWRQAFSDDKGETWEWNWYMYISRDE